MTFGSKNINHFFTIILLISAVAIFEATVNILLPVLPTIQQFFNIKAHEAQSLLSAYLLGFALFGLFAGPFSDNHGRRTTILFGLLIFWLGSFMSYFFATSSIQALVVSRFCQGLGAGISTVLVAATIRDLFDLVTAARILSLMGMITALAPMIAPIIGGALADFGNWITIFFILFIAASVLLLAFSLYGKETLIEKKPFNPKQILVNCYTLTQNKKCLFFIVISSLAYACLFAWIVQAPFYFEYAFGLSDFNYALYAALGPLVYIVGSFMNFYFLPTYGLQRLLYVGLLLSFAGCICLIGAALWPTPYLLFYLLGFLIFNTGISFVFANASAKAIDVAGNKRGTASAFLASIEQLLAAIASYGVGLFGAKTLLPSIIFMSLAIVIALFLFKQLKKVDFQVMNTHV